MAITKLLILKAVTPPGFTYKKIDRDAAGVPRVKEVCNICKPGNVIEIDEPDLVARYGIEPGYCDRLIKAGIAAPAPAIEKVTDGKRATHGEYLNASSGEEKQNTVPAKADAGDK
jgi:hypothetical protein